MDEQGHPNWTQQVKISVQVYKISVLPQEVEVGVGDPAGT